MNLVFCDVDMDDERNKSPKSELDEGEVIETFKVPLVNLHYELKKVRGTRLRFGCTSRKFRFRLSCSQEIRHITTNTKRTEHKIQQV